jgi:hypothetical protein
MNAQILRVIRTSVPAPMPRVHGMDYAASVFNTIKRKIKSPAAFSHQKKKKPMIAHIESLPKHTVNLNRFVYLKVIPAYGTE